MSEDATQRPASGIDSCKQTNEQNHTSEKLAEPGDLTPFYGIRVVDESESGASEEFADFTELRESNWTVGWTSPVRLTDGSILYEGRQ